ncbi:MAG TPA: hypothetical protein ENI10_09125 [Halomonas sp.]|nr:hypothetical protein [Halomonas sp.]HDZ48495.1 hypothetical protein [Halomonas sp.]HEB04739.1 hypothetical protein [Halomonas sp.]
MARARSINEGPSCSSARSSIQRLWGDMYGGNGHASGITFRGGNIDIAQRELSVIPSDSHLSLS